jgi:hemerythrin-like domain-containing protein
VKLTRLFFFNHHSSVCDTDSFFRPVFLVAGRIKLLFVHESNLRIKKGANMQATQILKDEHRLIERVLTALQTAASRLSQGAEISPTFFINAALFIKNFADGSHHCKEEDILFAAMSESGVPSEGGPIGVMLSEHEQARAFTREMKEAAQKWQAGDSSARTAVVHNALGYVSLLRVHIHKEDNILFPMADRLIPPDRQAIVNTDFEHIGHDETEAGVHEKYTALAEELEQDSMK